MGKNGSRFADNGQSLSFLGSFADRDIRDCHLTDGRLTPVVADGDAGKQHVQTHFLAGRKPDLTLFPFIARKKAPKKFMKIIPAGRRDKTHEKSAIKAPPLGAK
jgi:hypothetical protein